MPKEKEIPQTANEGFLEVTENIIRERAYQLFEQRGYEHGHDVEDRLQAESEITSKKLKPRADQTTTVHKVAAA